MLRIGSRDTLHVRQQHFNWGLELRMLYASDLHLTRWSPHVAEQIAAVCQQYMPDLLLLGGDLVDLPNGLPLLAQLIQAQSCPVWAIGGNHDEWVGLKRVQNCVEWAGGHWLDEVIYPNQHLSISRRCQPVSGTYTILCTHDPAVFPQAVHCGYRLVLAGHLHGGQCVLAQRNGKTYPGVWFSQWNGDHFVCGQTTMLVSRGVHDTLPVRWNCPREVILCCC
jgi:uncharacterized protein